MTTRRRPVPSRRLRDIHIFRDEDRCGWVVMQGTRRVSVHRTQAEAVCVAIRKAKRACVDVVTHGRDGRIRSKDSHGNESPVRDTEH